MKEAISKNVSFNPTTSIEYASGGIVSKQISKNDAGNITLFAFDKDQGLSEHSAPFDAIVHIIDGEAEVTINQEQHIIKSNEMIIMPANIPHSLHAARAFKMLLTMIKG